MEDLYGKSIKDKRGGDNNIHSWDIGIKGEVSDEQIILLNKLFKERRKIGGCCFRYGKNNKCIREFGGILLF